MTDSILEFITNYKDLAIVLVFLIAFIESMVLLGIFLPGWLLLVGIGGLIGADILSFYPIVLSAYFGAVTGEYLSFYLGYHYHHKILSLSFFRNHQKLINSSQIFFQKHGVAGVFIGRFFGPTRALVPFLAGLSEMPQKTFFWINGLSGILWAPLYLIPGILVGAAFTIEQEERNQLLLLLFLVAIGISMAVKFILVYLRASQDKKTLLLKSKMSISICTCLIMIALFVQSSQWELFLQIISVVASKL